MINIITGRTKLILALFVCLLQTPGALSHTANPKLASADTQSRLKEIENRRKELHAKLSQARMKERLALLQLHKIKTRLEVTKGVLHQHQHLLTKTVSKISETQHVIEHTHSTQMSVSNQAAIRLREIYEGQRLTLLEMFFQVSSLQSLIDLCYYQERVAQMDRKILEQLKAKAESLEAKKGLLGEQKNHLGDLITQFAKKALQINQEKSNQEQVAERLRTQRAFYEQAERQLAMESQRLEHQIVDMESANRRSSGHILNGSGTLSTPLQAPITSPFGWRRHPIFGVRRFHTGIDLAGANHSAIKAADSGTVLYSGWYGGYGKVVIVSHGKGMATLYAHMSKAAVNQGENVTKGEVVGYEGTTGFSTGPHLHFEVRINGKPNNPLNFL